MNFRNEYRIVRGRYFGFIAEFRPWWSFRWRECYSDAEHDSVEYADRLARIHAGVWAKSLGRLPG